MKCPRCSSPLTSTQYDGQEIELCSSCQGQWLSAGELLKIVEHHDEVFTEAEIDSLDAVNKEIFTDESADHDELNCPSCEDVQMEHFNYADTSGIILHKCPDCEGIWMDKDELKKVEAMVDGWKSDLQKDVKTYGPVLKKVELEEQKSLDKAVSISRIGFVNAYLRKLAEFE